MKDLKHADKNTSEAKLAHDDVAKKAYAIYLKEGRRREHAAQNWSEADFGDKVLPGMRYTLGNHVENAVSPTGGV